MATTIILLNGAGSAGKSSIARALQALAEVPLLHVQMDTFLDMMPEPLQTHADGISYEEGETDGRPSVAVKVGPVGARVLHGMRHAIAAMAGQGNNLIVDDVLCDGEIRDYRQLLSSHDLRVVGVFAPLHVLEQREVERGDRLIGLARWQFDRVHRGIDYDLTVDSGVLSPLECARRIKEKFGL